MSGRMYTDSSGTKSAEYLENAVRFVGAGTVGHYRRVCLFCAYWALRQGCTAPNSTNKGVLRKHDSWCPKWTVDGDLYEEFIHGNFETEVERQRNAAKAKRKAEHKSKYISYDEAAALSGLSPNTIRDLCNEGIVKATEKGERGGISRQNRCINRASFTEYILKKEKTNERKN